MTRRTLRWYLAPVLAAPIVAVVLIASAGITAVRRASELWGERKEADR